MNSLMEFIWQIIIFLFKKAGDPVSAVTRDLLKNYTEGFKEYMENLWMLLFYMVPMPEVIIQKIQILIL